jgi:AraC-like DNA-binding protein
MNVSFLVLNGFLIFGSKKGKVLPDKILGFWLLILAIQIFLVTINNLNQNKLIYISIPFTLLHGPLLFEYAKKLVYNEQIFTIRDSIHFIPFMIGFFIGLTCQLLQLDDLFAFKMVKWSGVLSGLIYSVCSLFLLKRYKDRIKNRFSNIEKINLNWLLNLSIGLLTIWVGASILNVINRFFHLEISLNFFFIIIPEFLFYIGFYGVRQEIVHRSNKPLKTKEEMENNPDMPVKKIGGYSKSGLQVADMKSIHNKLLVAMKKDMLYLNATLSLSELSKTLNIPAHHITQTLNEYVGVNFYDFINNFRVNEFKKRISTSESINFSLLGVALECGFNSKSTFNRIFKKYTNQSPSEYTASRRDKRSMIKSGIFII